MNPVEDLLNIWQNTLSKWLLGAQNKTDASLNQGKEGRLQHLQDYNKQPVMLQHRKHFSGRQIIDVPPMFVPPKISTLNNVVNFTLVVFSFSLSLSLSLCSRSHFLLAFINPLQSSTLWRQILTT